MGTIFDIIMMYAPGHMPARVRWLATRTTLNIDDQLPEMARRIIGMTEKASLMREGARALIGRGSEAVLFAATL